MNTPAPLRLFLDSNVLTGGILAAWGLDKAVLSLCASRICRLVLAEVVRLEVERNLLTRASTFSAAEAEQVLDDYIKMIEMAQPEIVPPPAADDVARSLHLIRHIADVPVLLSAMHSQPDWLLTHNTKHFTSTVGKRAGLQIATPAGFFRRMAESLKA
jgi:predicted nucleic acid-binding protein